MRAIDRPAGTSAATTAPGRSRRRLLIAGAAAAAILGAVVAAMVLRTPSAPPAAAGLPQDQLVTAFAVAPRDFVRTAPVSGEVRPVEDVRVFASAQGVRIAEILAEIGDRVEAGAPLARLDAGIAEAQISAARARLEQAKIEAARAGAEYARIAAIADTGALSKEEIENRRAAAAAARARVAAEQAAFAEISARLNGGYVVAPVGGLVIERNARVGEFADQQALFRIVGGERLEVAAAVAESDMLAMRAGQIARFRTSDGAVIEGVLRRPPVAVSATTRAGEALFDLPAEAAVRAGMYLRGEVELETVRALAAPASAVTYASGEPSVFVIRDGRARLTPVTLGARSGDFVAVLSGLEAGEEIAASGGAFLLDGDAVRVGRPEAVVAGR